MKRLLTILLLTALGPSAAGAATVHQDTFTPIPDYDWGPPRWEVRAAVLPIIGRSFQIRDPLSTNVDNEFFTPTFRTYLLNDGRTIELARQPIVNSSNGGRFGETRFKLAMTSIELVNHRPRGFRYSAGLSYFQDDDTLPSDFSEFDDVVDASNFMRLSGGRTRQFYGFLGAQYTINRRHRFRVHVGLALMFLISETSSSETVLYGGATPEAHPVSEIVTRNRSAFGVVLPLPQLTLEYAITNEWSVSLGGGPSTGLGIGYRW